MESGTLTVYHVGVHNCHLKKDIKIYKKQVREAMLQNKRFWVPEVFSRLRWAKQLLTVIFMKHREEQCNSCMQM